MKWIKIALKYCTFTSILLLERKKAIFNVKYEIVLRTPYSKAWWGGRGGEGQIFRAKRALSQVYSVI